MSSPIPAPTALIIPTTVTEPELLIEIRNSIAYLTLNRPNALNALSRSLLAQMDAELKRLALDDSVYAVVVRGAGERAFCAGGDIKAMYEGVKRGKPDYHAFFCTEYPVNHLIYNYSKPYIAIMDRLVMGGGMGISQGARIRVVTERSKLAMPETGIGLIPDVGASYFLNKLPGAIAQYMGLTGNTISAADALALGLADRYLPSDKLPALYASLDNIRWSLTPVSEVAALMRQLAEPCAEASALMVMKPAIDEHFSKATLSAIIASLEGEARPEYQTWAQATLTTLAKRSPTSMALVLEQLQRAKGLSLAACLRMELDLVSNCFEFGDIVEGIRAVVIDKDHQPKWQPASVDALAALMAKDPAHISRFFDRRWPGVAHPLAFLGV